MTPEIWVRIIEITVVPFLASWFWLIWQVRRMHQTLYGSNGDSLTSVVARIRKDEHWAANCLLVLGLTARVALPDRPSLR